MDLARFKLAKQFMFNDIERELQLARVPESDEQVLRSLGVRPGGGNFLAALGLLCYTEFGGKLKFNCTKPGGADHASENFNRFFDELGPGYAAFREGHNVYDVFRCGLAHEYFVKKHCIIAMLGTGIPSGIHELPDGRYEFAVEQYCLDLRQAFERLEQHLFGTLAGSPP